LARGLKPDGRGPIRPFMKTLFTILVGTALTISAVPASDKKDDKKHEHKDDHKDDKKDHKNDKKH
jgi:hypothetical protein